MQEIATEYDTGESPNLYVCWRKLANAWKVNHEALERVEGEIHALRTELALQRDFTTMKKESHL